MIYTGLFLTGVAIALVIGFGSWLWMACEICKPEKRDRIRLEAGAICGTALCLLVFVTINLLGRV